MSSNALGQFWQYTADFQSLQGWMVKAGFVAPLLPMLVQLGPPWNGDSWIRENAPIAMLTAIVQLVVLTSVFSFTADWTPADYSRPLRRSLYLLVAGLVLYTLFFFTVTKISESSNGRFITGWEKTEDYKQIEEINGDTSLSTAFRFFNSDPRRLWKEPGLTLNYVTLILLWLLFFASVTLWVALFTRLQIAIKNANEQDIAKKGLHELGMDHALRRRLEDSGIRSVEDLISKSREELSLLPGIGKATIKQIDSILQAKGLHLRGEGV